MICTQKKQVDILKKDSMKKNIIYLLIAVLLVVFVYLAINNKSKLDTKTDTEPVNLLEAVYKNNGQKDYYKFQDGDILNEDTFFIEYAFISNNKAYIFNPEKIKTGEVSYKKVYDIPSEIKITNIGIPYGADIYFYDNNGYKYSIRDTNMDNNLTDEYQKYENAKYELKKYTDSKYQIDADIYKEYDMRCNRFYVKDDIIYKINYSYYHYTEKRTVPTTVDKVEGNYENEKIIHIYNDRIVRTDKAFYELVEYSNSNQTYTTTMKIDLLTRYYDDVLTFTYDYVVLKDYTLIPINDVMTNRMTKYLNGFYLAKFDEKPNSFIE